MLLPPASRAALLQYLDAAKAATRGGDARRAMALTFRAEKKRLLSELENRLNLLATRSKKAGRVVRG